MSNQYVCWRGTLSFLWVGAASCRSCCFAFLRWSYDRWGFPLILRWLDNCSLFVHAKPDFAFVSGSRLLPECLHDFVLWEESLSKPDSRCCFELILFHGLREYIFDFFLSERVHFCFEHLSESERFNLKTLALSDEVIHLTHTIESNNLPLFLSEVCILILANCKKALVFDNQIKGGTTLKSFICPLS